LPIGLQGGAVQCALEVGEMPGHTHPVWAYHNSPNLPNPGGNAWTTASEPAYSATAMGYMSLNSIQFSGQGLAHENQQPYLVMNYCICCHGLSF
jgi:microcystin-dependent protein